MTLKQAIRLLNLMCAALAVPCILAQPFQSAQERTSSTLFKSESRLVVVDVVARDLKGHVVVGLRPQNFSVFEDGKPQQIRFFEDHTAMRKVAAPAPQLPPNQYTNYPTETLDEVLNIVLLDLANTPARDQVFARQQMLKGLEALPKGRQLALFVLGARLQMIQGPAGNSEALIEAAKSILASPTRLTNDNTQIQAENSRIESFQQMAGGGSFGTPTPVDEGLRVALGKEQSAIVDTRLELTLGSMEQIARIVAGYPGRKNLIWVTGGVPFQFGADMKTDKYHRFRERHDLSTLLKRAEASLSASQIAIYPVDASGLAVLGVDSSVSGRTYDMSGSQYSTALNDQSDSNWNNRVAMRNLADETGGRASLGTNDLGGAITSSIEQGSRYYTIAYVPRNPRNDDRYRSIKVEAAGGKLALEYRRGYYAGSLKTPSASETEHLLAGSMQLGVPPSTALLMKVQVLPPDADNQPVRVDYAFATSDLQFVPTDDHRNKATLYLMAVAYDDQGKTILSNKNTEEVAFKQGTAAEEFNHGVPGHQEFSLPPGKYILCLGAMDRTSLRIGTLWLPLVVGNHKTGKGQ